MSIGSDQVRPLSSLRVSQTVRGRRLPSGFLLKGSQTVYGEAEDASGTARDVPAPAAHLLPRTAEELSTLLAGADRLAAVLRLELLDSPVDEALDRLTRLAARLLGAPVAQLSVVGSDRQYFKSRTGRPGAQESEGLEYSLCGLVAATGQPLVVDRTQEHPVLGMHLAVTEQGVAAYAGGRW